MMNPGEQPSPAGDDSADTDVASADGDEKIPPAAKLLIEADAPATIDVPFAPGTDGAMDVMVAAEVLRRVNRTRHVVGLVSQAIIRSYDEEVLYHEVCRLLVNFGGYLMAWVGIAEETPDRIVRPVGHAGIETNFLQALKITWDNDLERNGPTGEAVAEERPFVARNIPTDPQMEVLRKDAKLFGYRAACAFPMKLGRHGMGVLTVHSLEPDAFGFEEVAFLRDLAGDLAAGVVGLRDRAKRRTLEVETRKAEARYRSIIENSREGIFLSDLHGRLLLVNDALVDLLGYESQAALLAVDPPTIATHMHPQDAEPTVEGMLRAAGAEPIKARMRHQRGDWVWVSMNVKVIEGPDGPIIEGFIQDMTAVHGQQEANARLAAVVNAADDAIVGTDKAGRVSDWNQGAARLFGFSRDEVVGRPIADFMVPDERRDEDARIRRAIEAGERVPPFETVRRCKDNRIIRTSVTISPILAPDGTVAGSTAVERDITQAHRTAAAKRAMLAEREEVRRLTALEKVRKTFISEASHELNTPLTPVRIHLEVLTEDPDLTPDQRKHLTVIERNVLRLGNLVHDMLDASRLDSGRFNLELDDVPLAVLVEDTVDSLAEIATAQGITLSSGHLKPVVAMADANRLNQVLHNLVTNAISFTPSGGRVTVSTRSRDGTAIVRVTDTGVGMLPHQIAQLFQPFARPHEGTGTAAKGTGLGLFISRGIVEQHGGRIWAESPGPGNGSSFCFSIPLAGPTHKATSAPTPSPRQPPKAFGAGASAPRPRVRNEPSSSEGQTPSEKRTDA